MVQTSSLPLSTRQDGSPLQINDVWIDTNTCNIKKWTGSQWIERAIVLAKFSANSTVAAAAKMPFNLEVTDTTNSYNTSTYEFTAPYTGAYLLSMQNNTTGANVAGSPTLHVNNVFVQDGWFGGSTCGFTITLQLTRNDIVTVLQSVGTNTYSSTTSQLSIVHL
jgi:hypothetical protein